MKRLATMALCCALTACGDEAAPIPSRPAPPPTPIPAPPPTPIAPVVVAPAPSPPPAAPTLDSLVSDLPATEHVHVHYSFTSLLQPAGSAYDVECQLVPPARCTYACGRPPGPDEPPARRTEVTLDAARITAALSELPHTPLVAPPPLTMVIEFYDHTRFELRTPTATVVADDDTITVGQVSSPFGGGAFFELRRAMTDGVDRACAREAGPRR
jgi:hypothetical protein